MPLAKEVVSHGDVLIEPDSRVRERVILDPSEVTSSFLIRVTGTLDNTTGAPAGDQVVRDEAIGRFLELELHTIAPNRSFTNGRISLRELIRYHNLNVVQVATITQPDLGTINAGNPTTFEAIFRIWGMRQYLFNPSEIFFPAFDGSMMPRVDSYVLDFFPNRDRLNANSDRGTDAFFSAGSDTIVFSAGPTVEVWQEVVPGHRGPRGRNLGAGQVGRGLPLFLPTYHSIRGDTITSAQDDYDFVPEHGERMDLVMWRHEESSDRNAQGIGTGRLNNISILAKRLRTLDEVLPEYVQEIASEQFPAYQGSADTESHEGYYPYLFAVGGRLRSAVNPDRHTNFRYVFDLDAPAVNPGAITTFSSLLEVP